MSMPKHFVLVRHGESEGNIVTNAAKGGDDSGYNDAFLSTPGSQWRLTDRGRMQAGTIGSWLAEQYPLAHSPHGDITGGGFDRFYVSPYVRTRETAAHLGLPQAVWRINRALRERDWGDISLIPRQQFLESAWWAENAKTKKADPLYWCTPNGESVAMIAEDRVRNVLDTLDRECSDQTVIAVSHGEAIQAFRLVLERMSDERFMEVERDKTQEIRNCEALEYRKGTGHRLNMLRRSYPVEVDGAWTVRVGEWQEFGFERYSNDDLLAQVATVPSIFTEVPDV